MLRSCALALAVAACLLGILELGVRAAFPRLPRLVDDFSAPYLRRVVATLEPHRSVVALGDSVLWGHGVAPAQTALALYGARRGGVVNLAFEGGSIANSYAMLRLLVASGHAPATAIMNVNIKEFNPVDSAYDRLHPALARLVRPDLSESERRALKPEPASTLDDRIEAAVSDAWTFYGMREEIRSLCFGAPDAATAFSAFVAQLTGRAEREEAAHRPTPERFLGTYDLSTLDDGNTELVFLRKLVALTRENGIRLVAIVTPANHRLLHDYIDVPEYDAQLRLVASVLKRGGATVLDYDRSIPPDEFLDNDHLTVAGNRRLASLLDRDVKP